MTGKELFELGLTTPCNSIKDLAERKRMILSLSPDEQAIYTQLLEEHQRKQKEAEDNERLERETKAFQERARQNYEYYKSKLPPRYKEACLENFKPQTELQSRAKRAAEDGASLILCGKSHIGKTYIGYATCDKFVREGKTARLIYANDLFAEIKEAFGSDSARKVVDKYVSYDYLVIDEFDKLFRTQTEFVYMNMIISQRYDYFRNTMIISNLSVEETQQALGAPIVNRIFAEGFLCELDGESWAKRLHGRAR